MIGQVLEVIAAWNPAIQVLSMIGAVGVVWRLLRFPLKALGRAWKPLRDGESPDSVKRERAGGADVEVYEAVVGRVVETPPTPAEPQPWNGNVTTGGTWNHTITTTKFFDKMPEFPEFPAW